MLVVKDPRDIKRVALNHEEDVEAELRAEVVARAHKHFGYTADEFSKTGPLAKELAALEIAPLNWDEVKAYMASKQREWSTHRNLMCGWAIGLGPIALGLLIAPYMKTGGDKAFTVVMGFLVSSMLNLIWHLPLENFHPEDYKYTRYWKEYTLGSPEETKVWDSRNGTYKVKESYERYVPVSLLNYAVQIKDALPEARLYVHELVVERERIVKPLPDPFLFVKLGSESYCIGVWDEREFEAKA